MFGERNSIGLSLLSAPKHDPSKYTKESVIANNNNKCAIGNHGNDKPLAKGDDDDNAPIANNNNDKPLANNIHHK